MGLRVFLVLLQSLRTKFRAAMDILMQLDTPHDLVLVVVGVADSLIQDARVFFTVPLEYTIVKGRAKELLQERSNLPSVAGMS